MSHFHNTSFTGPLLSRRMTLGGMAASLSLAAFRPARAGVAFPQRLVIINVLGGLDGLSAVVPYGDPQLLKLRAPLVPPAVGQPGGMFDLGGYYGLNPAMPNLYAMYKSNQMLAVQAVGGIITTHSHFAGQSALATGQEAGSGTGWMNRLTALLPTVPGGVECGIVLGPSMPAIAQGSVQQASWAPAALAPTPNTLAALIETLGVSDPLIGGPIQSGFNDKSLLQNWLAGAPGKPNTATQHYAQAAGAFISAPGGPAVAVITTPPMDTHTNQVARLGPLLSDLDTSIGMLAAAAGNAWANTVVMTITEFGRTAQINGCGGTDHGGGFAMFLAGGAVAGGRVIADWRGLGNLLNNRDVLPTTDIRAVIGGVLRDHMNLKPDALATIFPDADCPAPMGGLVTG